MMEPSFEKLLAALAEAQVRFVLVGGLAVGFHGYVRLTEDVDILIDASDSNVRALLDCLSGFGEGFARELSTADFGDEEGAIRVQEETENCQIDIFTRMSGLRYDDLVADSGTTEVRGHQVRYASKVALIKLKGSSVREKDRMDVNALQQLERDPHAFD